MIPVLIPPPLPCLTIVLQEDSRIKPGVMVILPISITYRHLLVKTTIVYCSTCAVLYVGTAWHGERWWERKRTTQNCTCKVPWLGQATGAGTVFIFIRWQSPPLNLCRWIPYEGHCCDEMYTGCGKTNRFFRYTLKRFLVTERIVVKDDVQHQCLGSWVTDVSGLQTIARRLNTETRLAWYRSLRQTFFKKGDYKCSWKLWSYYRVFLEVL